MKPLIGKKQKFTRRPMITVEIPSAVPASLSSRRRQTLRTFYAFEPSVWAARSGASLQLQRFERFKEAPVIARGPEGSHDEHRVYSINVWRDRGRFVAWYSAMRRPDPDPWKQNSRHSLCIAYSDDGVTWEKPDLRKVHANCDGAPNNVLRVPDRFYCAGVIHDGSRYVMKYEFPVTPGSTTPNTSFCIFTSDNGIEWQGERQPLIRERHFESANSIYHIDGQYFVMGQGISPYFQIAGAKPFGRVNFVYRSRDLSNWTLEPQPAYAYPSRDYFPDATLQTHCGASVCDRGRIQLGFMGQFWPSGFSETVRSTFGLIYSYDGLKWQEPFVGEPLLLPSEQGWDHGMLIQGNGFYSRGVYSYYWYTGMDGGNLWSSRAATGICRIRRDGFACFTPTAMERTPALLQTTRLPIEADIDRFIYLNCIASAQSPIEVAIVDPMSGKILISKQIMESGVAVEAFDLSMLPRGIEGAELRFSLHGQSRLYTFYIATDDALSRCGNEWS